MTATNDSWEHKRRRWMRPNARLYIRPDASRFMPAGKPRVPGKQLTGWLRIGAEVKNSARRYRVKFDPDQPRVSAGNPDGGQWTNDTAPTDISAARRQSAAYCWNQMQIDILYCQSLLPSWRVAACIKQANERFSACLVGRLLPPLPF